MVTENSHHHHPQACGNANPLLNVTDKQQGLLYLYLWQPQRHWNLYFAKLLIANYSQIHFVYKATSTFKTLKPSLTLDIYQVIFKSASWLFIPILLLSVYMLFLFLILFFSNHL